MLQYAIQEAGIDDGCAALERHRDGTGYDYNALIRATTDGEAAFDPRYGKADLFEPGTRSYVSMKYLF